VEVMGKSLEILRAIVNERRKRELARKVIVGEGVPSDADVV